MKFDFILEYDDKNDELKEIIKTLETQDPYSVIVLNMKYDLLENKEDKKNFIGTIKKAKTKYFSENKLKYDMLLLRILDNMNDKIAIRELLDTMSNHDIYKSDSLFLRTKAQYILKKFDDLKDAIQLLKESLDLKERSEIVILLVEYLLYANKIEEAKNIISKYKFLLSKEDFLNLEKELYDHMKDYREAYNKVKELQKLNIQDTDKYIVSLSYYLLHEEKYEEAKILLKEYLDKKNFSLRFEIEIINYEFACKKTGSKPHKKRLESISTNKNTSNLTKAAIFAINDNKVEVFKALNLELEKDYTQKYIFKTWPIFKSISNDKDFIKLVSSD